jgi:hypothetical protein
MEHLFSIVQGLTVESPQPLVIVLVLAGVALMAAAINRHRRRPAIAACMLWLLAVALMVVSPLVVTQRERIIKATRALVQATAKPANIDIIRQSLTPDAILLGPDGGRWLDIDQLTPTLQHALERWPIDQQNIHEVQIIVRGTQAVENLVISSHVNSDGDFSAGSVTQWQLIWREEPKDVWRVQSIQWLKWMGQKPTRGLWQ